MTDNITNFSFQPANASDLHPVRTITKDGEPWFIATDVADVLGYARPHDAIQRHCKGSVKHGVLSGGGIQEMTIIPERDVYRLVMRSKLPSAEQFEEWVVSTVLPTLRKTGSYVVGEEALNPSSPGYIDRLKDMLIEAQDAKLADAEKRIAALSPKAAAFQVIEEAEGAMTVTLVAKTLKSKRNDLFRFLERRKWLTKGPYREPTAYAVQRGYMTVRTSTGSSGRIHSNPVVTPKGLAYLAELKASLAA